MKQFPSPRLSREGGRNSEIVPPVSPRCRSTCFSLRYLGGCVCTWLALWKTQIASWEDAAADSAIR